MSYADKFQHWEKLGVEVTPVVSRPEGTGWEGATGYVQDVARAAGLPNPESTAIFLCGVKGMTVGVKELAAEAGVAESRVITNF
jgi:NAD(P)H-flavin reductase